MGNTKYDIYRYYHTRDESHPAAPRDPKKEAKRLEMIEKRNKEREVCLACTKKKCYGTKVCFEKETERANGDK